MKYSADETVSIISMLVDDAIENGVDVTEDIYDVVQNAEFVDENRFQDDA